MGVKTIYRRALREGENWILNRNVWYDFAEAVRAEIEKNKNEKDPEKLQLLCAAAEIDLDHNRHPIPYIIPTEQGGTSWGRNVIPPIESLERAARAVTTGSGRLAHARKAPSGLHFGR